MIAVNAVVLVLSLATLPVVQGTPQAAQGGAGQKAALSAGDLAEAERLTKQAITLYGEGKYADGLEPAERSLELRRKLLSKDDPLVAAALYNLASLHFALKQYSKAEPLYQECLRIYEQAFGPDDPKLCGTMEQLGWARYASGGASGAEKLFRRSLEIKEKAFGPNSAEVALSANNLGRFYEKTGNFSAALPLYQRALAIMEGASGPNSNEVATELDRCGCMLLETGRTVEALELRNRASIIRHDVNVIPNQPRPADAKTLTGMAIRRVEPVYPPEAKHTRTVGSVMVEVHIDKTGKVTGAKQICGPDIFSGVSVEAAKKWLFAPTVLEGSPVEVIGTITFNFKM
jgi:TonB family protein